jgi:Tfp pilus assembly protein PilV
VTLVEVMVVLVLFAIGILAVAAVQTRSQTVVYATGTEMRAMAICQAQLETARAAGFGVAVPDSGTTGNFDWMTQVIPVNPTMDRVRVTVSWAEQGEPRTVMLNTMLSDR